MKTTELDFFAECFKKVHSVVLDYSRVKKPTRPSHYIQVYEKKEGKAFGKGTKNVSTLAMKCFAPSYVFSKILEDRPHSLLITSGTLSPLDGLDHDLGIPFAHKLSCQHVIQPTQVLPLIISRGVKHNTQLNFSYASRDSQDMIEDVGHTLVEVCRQVPQGGILVFFSSYGLMQQYSERWAGCGVIKEIEKSCGKTVMIEHKNQE